MTIRGGKNKIKKKIVTIVTNQIKITAINLLVVLLIHIGCFIRLVYVNERGFKNLSLLLLISI